MAIRAIKKDRRMKRTMHRKYGWGTDQNGHAETIAKLNLAIQRIIAKMFKICALNGY